MLRKRLLFVSALVSILLLGCATDKELVKKKARAREDLGLTYVRQGNLRAGVENLLEAAKLDPDNADVQYELGNAYKWLGVDENNPTYFQSAVVHLKRAIELRPAFPEASNELGTVYLKLSEWDLAIACFEDAAKQIKFKTPWFAYNNMGLAYYHMGNYDKAIESYKQALQLSPSYSRCQNNLGLAYQAKGDWEAAEKAFKQAIEHDPNSPDAYLNLGKLYARLGQRSKAAEALMRTMEIDPEGPFGREARDVLRQR
jgi:type IV pilus assembly protein PilF